MKTVSNETGTCLVVSTSGEYGYETEMIKALRNRSVITPKTSYIDGEMCLSYNIDGLVCFKNYVRDKKLDYRSVSDILIQIKNAESYLVGHMLSAANLCLKTDFIYADAEDGMLRFPVFPEGVNDCSGAGRQQDLLTLAQEIFMRADEDDYRTLLLAGMVLRRALSEESCIDDFVRLIGECRQKEFPERNRTYENTTEENRAEEMGWNRNAKPAAEYEQSPEKKISADREQYTAGSVYTGEDSGAGYDTDYDTAHDDDEDFFEADEESSGQGGFVKRNLLKAVMIFLIMAAGLLAVYFIRGPKLALRVLPVFIIMCASLELFMLLKKQG